MTEIIPFPIRKTIVMQLISKPRASPFLLPAFDLVNRFWPTRSHPPLSLKELGNNPLFYLFMGEKGVEEI